jgi:nucleotide-binding universal stress UspA family protein
MSNKTIKRILVGVDASQANRSLVQAANMLASKLDAELQALFVEDINLLQLAQLPLAREMTYGSTRTKQISPPELEKQLKAQVARIRQFVEDAARLSNTKVSFNVTRGQVETELCSAAKGSDLLIVGKNTQLMRYSEKLGRISQKIISNAACNILLLQHGSELGLPVVVFFDGSEASQRALQLGIQLAKGDHDQLVVIYPRTGKQALQQQVLAQTSKSNIDPAHVELADNSPDAIIDALANCNGRVLLLTNETDVFTPEQRQAIIKRIELPVIVIR